MDLNLFTKPSLREYLLSNLFGNCLEKPYVYSPFLFELTHSLFREKNHIPRVFVRNNQEQLLKTAPACGSETRLNKQVKNVLRKSGKWEVHRGFENLQYIPGNMEGHVHYLCCAHDYERLQKALISQLVDLKALS